MFTNHNKKHILDATVSTNFLPKRREKTTLLSSNALPLERADRRELRAYDGEPHEIGLDTDLDPPENDEDEVERLNRIARDAQRRANAIKKVAAEKEAIRDRFRESLAYPISGIYEGIGAAIVWGILSGAKLINFGAIAATSASAVFSAGWQFIPCYVWGRIIKGAEIRFSQNALQKLIMKGVKLFSIVTPILVPLVGMLDGGVTMATVSIIQYIAPLLAGVAGVGGFLLGLKGEAIGSTKDDVKQTMKEGKSFPGWVQRKFDREGYYS